MAKVRPGKRERAAFKLRLEQQANAPAHDPNWSRYKSCINRVQTTEFGSDFRVVHETSKNGSRWPNAPRRKAWQTT